MPNTSRLTSHDVRADRDCSDGPHVYSVEWTAWERVFGVDGEEHHRERRAVVLPRQRIVRSVLTCDYEVVEDGAQQAVELRDAP